MTTKLKRFFFVLVALFATAVIAHHFNGTPRPDALSLLTWAGVLTLLLEKD